RGTTNPALFTEARSCPAVPPCLVLSAVYRPPPRHGLLDHWSVIVLPYGSKASSGTCLHRSFTNRRLSGAQPQLRTTPRRHLSNVFNCCAELYTFGRLALKCDHAFFPRGTH